MKWHDIEHHTDEWNLLRAGKKTGSTMSKIMANSVKKDSFDVKAPWGDPSKQLAKKIAAERITGKPVLGGYKNAHMERGHEQEPLAAEEYEKLTFNTLSNGGFYDWGTVGISPDRRLNDDGLAEIKSVVASTHVSNIIRQSYDPSYKWQYISQLRYSDRNYLDFISYCHDFPQGKKIYICTIEKEKVTNEMEWLEARLEKFEEEIEKYIEIILNSNYEVKYEPAA